MNTSVYEAEPIHDPKLSCFDSVFDKKPLDNRSISEVIDLIRGPVLAVITKDIADTYAGSLKDGPDAAKRSIDGLKKRLPCVTLPGVFRRRSIAGWEAPSMLVQVDVDLWHYDEFEKARALLASFPWVTCLWTSPSGYGIKAGVRIWGDPVASPGRYTQAWNAVTRWLESIGLENDPATKDCSRLSYLAHDPQAIYRSDAEVFDLARWSVPDGPIPAPAAVLDAAPPTDPVQPDENDPELEQRALAYLMAMPRSVQGKNGSAACMAAVRVLRHGFNISGDAFWRVITAWNQARAMPEWRRSELQHKLDGVESTPPRQPPGWLRVVPMGLTTASPSGGVSPPVARGETHALQLRSHADRKREREQPPAMVIAGCLPMGGLGAVVAMPGSGKTLVGLEMARCVAAGEPFLGQATMPGRVIYCCPDSPASTERRMLAMGAAGERVLSVTELPRLPAGQSALADAVAATNAAAASERDKVRLVVIDTWDSAREHSDGGWAGQDATLEASLSDLRSLAAAHGLGVLIVHHATRADNGRARGSVVFDARCDFIGVAEGNGKVITIKAIKNRDGVAGPLGRFTIATEDVSGRPEPVLRAGAPEAAPATATLAERLLRHLTVNDGPRSVGGLAKALGERGKGGVERALTQLRKDKCLEGYTPTTDGRKRVEDAIGFPGDDGPGDDGPVEGEGGALGGAA